MIDHLSFSPLGLSHLSILSGSERVFHNPPVVIIVSLLIFAVILLIDGLDEFLQLFGGVFVEGIEDTLGKLLSVSDNAVPFLFQGALLDHGHSVVPV